MGGLGIVYIDAVENDEAKNDPDYKIYTLLNH